MWVVWFSWSSEDFAYIDKPKLVRSRVLPESLQYNTMCPGVGDVECQEWSSLDFVM